MGWAVIDKVCPVCGVTYSADPKRLSYGRQTTCSRACSYEFRSSKLTKAEKLSCAICGKTFQRPPSRMKSKHGSEFCSPECHYQGRKDGLSIRVVEKPYVISDEARTAWKEGAKKTRETRLKRGNYAHSEETKKTMSERTSRAIAEGRIKRVSKLEDRVAEYLLLKGVQFERQFGIRDPKTGQYLATLDFLVDASIALEVNGTFWHADPRFYKSDQLKPAQIRSLERWEKKIAILETLRLPLLIVWEHDLKSDFEGTLDALVKDLASCK